MAGDASSGEAERTAGGAMVVEIVFIEENRFAPFPPGPGCLFYRLGLRLIPALSSNNARCLPPAQS
jgi:hypothetical protein